MDPLLISSSAPQPIPISQPISTSSTLFSSASPPLSTTPTKVKLNGNVPPSPLEMESGVPQVKRAPEVTVDVQHTKLRNKYYSANRFSTHFFSFSYSNIASAVAQWLWQPSFLEDDTESEKLSVS